jgi:hypothetical protein
MNIDSIQPSPPPPPVEPPPVDHPPTRVAPRQAVTGVTPPQRAEAIIREVRPSAAASPALSGLARWLTCTIILAPLGWLLLAPHLTLKVGVPTARALIGTIVLAPLGWLLLGPLLLLKLLYPAACQRYTLTNRRLMVRCDLARSVHEVALSDIDDVRLDPASRDDFYHSGALEVVSQGKVVLHLAGVPQPDAFRQSILNAVRAWAPGKAPAPFVPASAKTGSG